MASTVTAEKACKVLSLVSALYLASGLVNIILCRAAMPVPRVLALVYIACFAVGALAVVAAFVGRPVETFRALALWSLGPAVPIFGTGSWHVGFPGMINAHVSFYVGTHTGRIFVGASLVAGLLFVLTVVLTTVLSRAGGVGSKRST